MDLWSNYVFRQTWILNVTTANKPQPQSHVFCLRLWENIALISILFINWGGPSRCFF